jgi:hypothetical protein
MADEDWLTLENANGEHEDRNQEVQINNYDEEFNEKSVDNDVAIPMTSKRSCFTRRHILVGMIGIVLVIGTAVGISLAVMSPSSGATANSTITNGKNKLENDSIGSNRVPAPTPAGIQYAGRPTASPGPTSSNAFRVADIIDGIARNGGNEFKDASSYQSRAKKWVLTQDFPVPDGSSLTMEQQATQLYALACIFYGTFAVKSDWTDVNYGPDVAIPGWYSSRGWLGTAEDICSNWHGISCNDQGRILKIELDTNGLTGTFPPETALLHETLNTIDLFNNIVHNVGDQGNNFLGELTNLEYLYLSATSVEYDGVPSVLGKLTALIELDFSETLYFGSLDGAAFSNLSNLRYLAMEKNAYNSPIPIELAQLPNLEYLHADFSFLEGSLDFITSMPKIVELWVDDNPNLKGPIPSGVGNMANLASFSASNCDLTGTIPTEIGSATNMIQMWLNDNRLTGEIPSEIANLVGMKILNVQNNDLEGDMPSKICDRKRPFGRLEELGADCDGAITCDEECCTCCGDQCFDR